MWPMWVRSSRLLDFPSSSTSSAHRERTFPDRDRNSRLDDRILFISFARVLALPAPKVIHLGSARFQSARIFATHTKQDYFCDVAEVEADTSAVHLPSLRILCQTMLLLYLKPQASMTAIPSGSKALGPTGTDAPYPLRPTLQGAF